MSKSFVLVKSLQVFRRVWQSHHICASNLISFGLTWFGPIFVGETTMFAYVCQLKAQHMMVGVLLLLVKPQFLSS
jgi:hypothetical protein